MKKLNMFTSTKQLYVIMFQKAYVAHTNISLVYQRVICVFNLFIDVQTPTCRHVIYLFFFILKSLIFIIQLS